MLIGSMASADPLVARGTRMMQQGRRAEAVELFQKAVARKPQSVEAHRALAHAYAETGRPGEAWMHSRKAMDLDPKDEAAAQTFNFCWQVLDQQGWINVGRSFDQVRERLGEPDADIDLGDGRRRWVYRWMGLDFVENKLFEWVGGQALGYGNQSFWPNISAVTIGGQRFVARHRARALDHGVVEYLPEGQTPQNHKKMIVLQRFVNGAETSVESRMRSNLSNVRRVDPDLQHRVIKSGRTDVTYEWWIDGEPATMAQHEITRLLTDGKDVLRFAYLHKVRHMPEKEQTFWVKVASGDIVRGLAGLQ